MLAELITIGDEILIGQIIDSNSAWMATELNKIGIKVKQITSVSDDAEHIIEALKNAEDRADIILVTGGLGPTKDDITKKTMAQYFKSKSFVLHEPTLKVVNDIFKRYNAPLLEVNKQQALVPDNCEVLLNDQGTAPSMLFRKDKKIFISMPGVPYEMMNLMTSKVIPFIKKEFNLPAVYHRTILTAGVGESFLAEKLADIEDSLPNYIKLAYLPKLGSVRLRLSTKEHATDEIKNEVQAYISKIIDLIPEYWVAKEDIPIEKAILNLMEANKLTLSVAESCTGGFISQLITQHPGCSSVFTGGGIVYSYELKTKLLGVKKETLEKFGAVSEETITEMVLGALTNFNSDYAIAVSGIAGPDGGMPDKPVGTVWIGVGNREKTVVKKFNFGNKRLQNIERSSIAALNLLFRLLKEFNAES
ncbi:MAG: competence/damage-inducible protein A [Bacteroidetes bacterium]|nr:competence/damage-inducible protein A [Bacteroidota bacterium]MBU1372536.1 competence/damage-inducible protein A [Bacteroidota bacterium]MBU1485055.1 competence/damage-inducible protein A [Bacteroidota bacterium]MBU1761501.1 competence/damage-inducible protein A [Bacteroidota bacterium]MBU2267967.1 competence/damage-inducible protein A [Bacteroidota bacterium]